MCTEELRISMNRSVHLTEPLIKTFHEKLKQNIYQQQQQTAYSFTKKIISDEMVSLVVWLKMHGLCAHKMSYELNKFSIFFFFFFLHLFIFRKKKHIIITMFFLQLIIKQWK